jgi:23S rRNA (pseudouridine1915-N3)-methyltransferase
VKIQIVRVGKISQSGLLPIAQEYRKRLSAFVKTDEIEIKADSQRDKRSAARSTEPLYQPAPGEFLILLDERGRQYDSLSLSRSIQGWMDDPRIKTLSFLIGPPYGFDDATRKAASGTWSLSALTLPSDFAWLMVWEQLYRAMTILKGMPYHHD